MKEGTGDEPSGIHGFEREMQTGEKKLGYLAVFFRRKSNFRMGKSLKKGTRKFCLIYIQVHESFNVLKKSIRVFCISFERILPKKTE